MLCFFLLPSLSFAQDASRNSWLFSVVVKLERMRDDAASDIARYEKLIRDCEASVSRSEAIITQFVQKGNVRAEQVARQALANAQEARKKNEAGKSATVTRKVRAEEAIARVRNLLTGKSPVDAEIQAVVSNYSGDVGYFSKRLNKTIAFDDARAGYLETGDEIRTSGGSRAQVHFLDGRGTIDIGENSKLAIERSDNDSQVIGLLKGKINVEVEKFEDFGKDFLKGLKTHWERKLSVRTPAWAMAVRGTRFLVSTDDSAGTELVVLEGSVEVRSAHEKNGDVSLMVDAGYRIQASNDGIISEPEKIDMTEIERWWEK